MRLLTRYFAATAIALASLIGASCVGSSGSDPAVNGTGDAAANRNAVTKTNAEELRVYVNIPQETEDIVWREMPGEGRLVAVMRFSKDDAAAVEQRIVTPTPPTRVSIQVEGWFPPELIAQADASGGATLSGNVYPAAGIILEPYKSGSIARIDNTDYFILEAATR